MHDKFNQFNLYSMQVNNEKRDETTLEAVNSKGIDFDIFLKKYQELLDVNEKLILTRQTFGLYDGEKFFKDKKNNRVFKVYISGTYIRIEEYHIKSINETGSIEQISMEHNK